VEEEDDAPPAIDCCWGAVAIEYPCDGVEAAVAVEAVEVKVCAGKWEELASVVGFTAA